MSLLITIDIQCDRCIAWAGGLVNAKASKARAHVKVAHGWVRKTINGKRLDLCPDCASKQSTRKKKCTP